MESEKTVAKTQSLDIGKCFNDAFDVYKQNIFILVLSALIFQVCSIFTLFILAGPLYGGYCFMMLNAIRKEDKKIELRDMFGMFNKFWPLLALFVVQAVLIFFGFLLLIIPGLILTAMWLFTYFVMIDQNKGVFEALKGSWGIVKNAFWINFALCVIYLLVSIVPGQIPYAGWLLGIFVLPFTVLMITSAYLQQAPEKVPDENRPFADAVKKEEDKNKG